MTTARPRLSLRLAVQTDEEKIALLRQAMEERVRVRWTYNHVLMLAEPVLLYSRNDSPHCEAVIVERGGTAVAETKLGSFKLAGLKNVLLTGDAYVPASDIDLADPRFAGGIIERVGD